MPRLEGKIAVITGGSSGIGLATAKRFVKEGAYVFITGRRQAELDKAVSEIGSNVTAVKGDVANPSDRARLQASAISHFETGTRKPSFDNLRRLADALDVTTDYLLGRVTDDQALAGADRLHRHFDRLSTEDRDMAESFLELLEKKAKDREKKGDE